MPKRPFSVGLSERLRDPDYVTEYLNSALQDSNEGFLLALRDVAEAQSMTEIAKSSRLDRVNLYRMLSERGNPRLSSLVAVLDSLGLEISVAKRERRKSTSEARTSKLN
jgi:probable addiction module antidote protein